jgi:hypothetical protein
MHGSARLALLLVTTAGCSALVTPDSTRLGPAGDAGPTLDARRELPDAFVPIGVDADLTDPDAPRPDPVDAWTPPTCVEGSARCEGDVQVVCEGGREVRTDCADTGLSCEAGACRGRVCTPGSVMCSGDGSGIVTCTPDGASVRYSPCPAGCDRATNACATSDACADRPTIALGDTTRIDLCAAEGMTSYVRAEGCGAMSDADSNDATFALTVREPTTVELDLRDVDPTVGIDTILYVRRACDASDSQLACSDDIPCTESDITSGCSGGVQVRQSRITLRLEPGTYYVVADALRYSDFDCGEVELRVGTP